MLPLLLALAAAQIASADRVKESDLAAHIKVLASDEYEGRKPGTIASGKTLSYIANAFARAGLEAAASDGGWYQPVPLVDRSVGASSVRWSLRGRPVTVPDEIVLTAPTRRQEIAGPVTFVGYGIDPAANLRGQVVLHLTGTPPGTTGAPGARARVEALRKAGAVAVIAISDAAAAPAPGASPVSWAQVRQRYAQVQTSRPPAADETSGVGGFISATTAEQLFTASGQDLAKLRTAAAVPGFRPVPLGVNLNATIDTTIRNYASHNVVARLPGRGRTGETMAIIGHWDHLGICRPEGAPDRICNGAVDNASGIAVMIEVADRLARGRRSARDIIFVATTAEESGLLGTNAYVDAPTVPLENIVAVLNIDTIAIGPRGLPVSAVNRGNTAIDPLIDEVARRQGRALDTDLDANAFINRQDGAAFTRAGVPAVMAGGSFADMQLLMAFLGGAYHGPEDEYSDAMPLGGAAEDAELHVLLARLLADPTRYRRPPSARP